MSERSPFTVTVVETSRDARGWASNLLDFLPLSPAQIKNIHLVSMQPDAIRGNHRHHVQTEWIIICGGPCRVLVDDGERRLDEMHDGAQPLMLTLPPGTAHAVQYRGDGEALLVCVTDTPYNFDRPDLERVILLPSEEEQ